MNYNAILRSKSIPIFTQNVTQFEDVELEAFMQNSSIFSWTISSSTDSVDGYIFHSLKQKNKLLESHGNAGRNCHNGIAALINYSQLKLLDHVPEPLNL